MYFIRIARYRRGGMAEIFISYKSERRKAAAHLAKILERYGYTVWFDYHLVKGDDFADEIDRRIREAKALVVLWCKLAVRSVWVRREAALAAKLGIAVPAMIEPCELRVDFASDDYTDLSGWNGAPLDRKLFPLLDGIAHRVGRPPRLDFMAMREYEEDWHRFGAPSLKAFALDAPVKAQEATQPKPLPVSSAEPSPSSSDSAPAAVSPMPLVHALNHAAEDWKVIEHSTDPRDFRAFIEEHTSGFLVRKARHKLEDLAEDAFAAAGRDKAALERFLRVHFDSVKVEAARAVLAEIAADERKAAAERKDAAEAAEQARQAAAEALEAAGAVLAEIAAAERARRAEEQRRREDEARQAEEKRRREQEARYRAEGRIKVTAAFAGPAGFKWFVPGAGKSEWFKDLDTGPEMVVVPAGSFLMGSPPDESERESWKAGCESPQHEVMIAKPFAIGRFAVTFAEWDAAQQDRDWQAITGRAARQPADEGWGRGDRPVIDVDWDDAKAYAKWLSKKTGKNYRLPSEAEWEYACRAGTTTPFWWGSSITPELANYDGSADPYKGGGKKGEYRQKTLPVKSFEPNAWGLYQVHGNVWEWCEDFWHDNYNGAPQGGSPWTTGDSFFRVLRGGSWDKDPHALRSAFRNFNFPRIGYRFRGFRVARTLPEASIT